MTTNHRSEALRLVKEAEGVLRPNDEGHCEADRILAEALVHATLARDEERTADTSALRAALIAWRNIVAHAVAWNLSFSETDEQHETWAELAHQLKRVGLDITADVDAITPQFGKDARGVWKPPTVQREDHLRWCAEMPTPWSDQTATQDTTEEAGR